MFTAKCRNKPRVSTVGDALLDLPLSVHMCQTPFNGHSADYGGFTETVVSSMAHEVRTAALPFIDSTAGSSCFARPSLGTTILWFLATNPWNRTPATVPAFRGVARLNPLPLSSAGSVIVVRTVVTVCAVAVTHS